MPSCPNCSRAVAADAKNCATCRAVFDAPGSWRPLVGQAPDTGARSYRLAPNWVHAVAVSSVTFGAVFAFLGLINSPSGRGPFVFLYPPLVIAGALVAWVVVAVGYLAVVAPAVLLFRRTAHRAIFIPIAACAFGWVPGKMFDGTQMAVWTAGAGALGAVLTLLLSKLVGAEEAP